MSVTTDIMQSYLRPARVMRRQLQAGEERALVYVMIGCLVLFVAGLPALARQVHLDPAGPGFTALFTGRLMGALLFAPLFLYGIAALSHLVARLFGGRGTWLGARLALFWSILVVLPLALFQGLVAGFIGQGPVLSLVSLIGAIVFLAIWMVNLREAERA